MTVRLLVPFNGLPAGATVTRGDEGWLISTGRAFALNRLRLLVPYNGLPAGATIGPNADAAYLISAGIAVNVAEVPAWVLAGPVAKSRDVLHAITDSRGANYYTASGANSQFNNLGIPNFTAMRLKQRFNRIPYNGGVGGENTEQGLARLPAVIAANPTASVYIMLESVNDRSTGNNFTYDRTVAALTGACQLLYDNQVFGALLELPRATGTVGGNQITPAQQAIHYQVNQWKKTVAPVLFPNIQYANSWDLLALTLGGTTESNPIYYYDATSEDANAKGLHLSDFGCLTASAPLDALLSAWFDGSVNYARLPTSNADLYNAGTNPTGCVIANPMMTGSGGTLSASGGATVTTSGGAAVIPASWTLTATAGAGLTIDVVESVDDEGYPMQVLTITGTPTQATPNIHYNQAISTLLVGGILRFGMRSRVRPGAQGIRGVNPYNSVTASTSPVNQDMAPSGGTNTNGNPFAAGISGYQVTPPLTVPATPTAGQVREVISFTQNVPVNAVIELGRAGPRYS